MRSDGVLDPQLFRSVETDASTGKAETRGLLQV